jgi:hypothetical protein
MIDELATAIPGAVAESVREVLATVLPQVVQAAVGKAAAELAGAVAVMIPAPPGSPSAAPPPTEPTPPPSEPGRMRAWARGLRDRLRRARAAVRSRVARTWSSARTLATLLVGLVRSSPRTAAVSSLVGVLVGAGAYWLGPVAAAALAGLAVGLLTLLGMWLEPLAGMLAPAAAHDG